MKKEDKEFLQKLKEEMLTQDTVCQANPRFWVVMQTVKEYNVGEDYSDGICIYDRDAAENVFEDNFEKLADWLKDNFDVLKKCEYFDGHIEITCDDDIEYTIYDIQDLSDFFDNYAPQNYSACNYREREEIVQDTMFLTIRECNEHIKRNGYHYNKPHSFAMTAWRSPQVEKLFKIIENTDWENI